MNKAIKKSIGLFLNKAIKKGSPVLKIKSCGFIVPKQCPR